MLLNSKVMGDGPDLVLLHGLFGSLENLGRIAVLLSQNYRVHLLDQRNHGRSPHASVMSYPLMAQDVREYLDDKQLSSVSILGHSMGGKVAMTLTQIEPLRVNALIIADIAPVHYPPHHGEIFKALNSLNLSLIKHRSDAQEYFQSFGIHADIIPFLLKNLVLDKSRGFNWRINLPVIERDYPLLMQAVPFVKEFERPVLFIVGALSDYVRKEHGDTILKLFPLATFKVLEGTSHWLHAEKPETFSLLAHRFLQKALA